jgi:catechol 2,3-dioxygenase-like lactoylglutathione lyase family enzyme
MTDVQFNALIPELCCSDIERSLRFYIDVLGFDVIYERPDEGFAFLEREGAQIMLEQYRESERTWLAGPLEHPYGRGINLQIEVSEVAPLHAAVTASSARILVPLEDVWYRVGDVEMGNRQFVVLDPDGYLLRFAQDLGARSTN